MRVRRFGTQALLGALVLAAAAAGGVASASAGAAATPGVEEERPNVVFIMVDDMRADDLPYMPRTSRLLGEAGVRFDNALSPHPLCCPARASVLTGWYTHNHRVFSVNEPFAFPSFPDESTIATWLQSSGYATHYIGKYLNGYGYLPEPGADSGTSVTYVPPGWTSWQGSIDGGLPASHPDNGGTYRYYDTTLNVDGDHFANYRGEYQTQVFGKLSRDVVQSRTEDADPFFLYVSYAAPHHGRPVERDDPGLVERRDGVVEKFVTPARPREFRGMFDDEILRPPGGWWKGSLATDKPAYLRGIPRLNRAEKDALVEATRQRAEALAVVDRQVGRTVRSLEAAGELDNTLVVFTSDNGYFLGEQGIRQGKNLPHEPSLRVPLLMRGPGIPAGEVRSDPFLSIDFPSTIAAATGIPLGHEVDGVDMLEVAREGDQGWTRPVLTTTSPRSTVRHTDEAGEPLDVEDPGQPDLRWAIGIRTDRYLYVDLASGDEELYDLSTDPDQYHNLVKAPEHQRVLELLRSELKRVRACDGAECRAPLPEELQTRPATP